MFKNSERRQCGPPLVAKDKEKKNLGGGIAATQPVV